MEVEQGNNSETYLFRCHWCLIGTGLREEMHGTGEGLESRKSDTLSRCYDSSRLCYSGKEYPDSDLVLYVSRKWLYVLSHDIQYHHLTYEGK